MLEWRKEVWERELIAMQQVLPFRRIAEATPHMDARVLDYINEGQIETFEGFENFNIIAFDWYDVTGPAEGSAQIMIYQDREDLFFFCEDERAEKRVHELIDPELGKGSVDNEQLLYRFFVHLMKDDVSYLDGLETEIAEAEERVLSNAEKDFLVRITSFRKELLRLKRYYEQIDSIFDELSANDNGLLNPDSVRRFVILGSRAERLRSSVLNLREYVSQTREAYQAQIDIQQNDIMKIFTVVTVIFLPLTLLVGWYGMNFRMPELDWRYSYPVVIVVSIALVVGLIVYFKRKKWF